MTGLDPQTKVTVKFGDLTDLQEIWWGFEGVRKLLELMGDQEGNNGIYYMTKPLFTRLEDLCFNGGLDANMIEYRLEKEQEAQKGLGVKAEEGK